MKVEIDGISYVKEVILPEDTDIIDLALQAPINYSSDFEKGTKVITYLYQLLQTLWIEGDSFSGKRPFGNSGWETDLIYALVDCGYIPGHLSVDSEDGYVLNAIYDKGQAERLILELIHYAFYRGS
jgi:hypothetical protein